MKNNIKPLREALGWSQEKLAEKAGTSGPQINRLEKSQRRLTQEWMMRISDALGCHPSDLLPDHKVPAARVEMHAGLREHANDLAATVPVLGAKTGKARDSILLHPAQETGYVPFHPGQTGTRSPFAFYVRGDTMAPRYCNGELVWVVRDRPPAEGQDCLIELKNGEAYLRRFIHQSDDVLLCRQLNPSREWRRDPGEIKALYPVVGRG